MKTEHAQTGRETINIILEQHEVLLDSSLLVSLLSSLPHPVFILNSKRQIIHYSIPDTSPLSISDVSHVLGKRPGEFLECVHHENGDDGCGTSDNCRYCGMVNTLLKCRESGTRQEGEGQLRVHGSQGETFYNFRITVSPLTISTETYYIVSLVDISAEKRREIMESVFFHDVLNTATGILGHLEYSIDFPDQVNDDSLDQSHQILTYMIRQIKGQRDLLKAENKNLTPIFSACSSTNIVQAAIAQVSYMNTATDKTIVLSEDSQDFPFQTDTGILVRVLVNMLKNALEASKKGEMVTIGCNQNKNSISFYVSNSAVMPEEVQAQIFNRAFSTKGSKRGIGTYSMKLFTEQVLGGKLTFESLPDPGTTFTATFQKEIS